MKLLLLLLIIFLESCAVGPDWSPDVTAHAASYSTQPVYSPQGVMLSRGSVQQGRKTMLHD